VPASLSLRGKLAALFRAGRNATNPELAAMFGAPIGSIGAYRCQLKKRGRVIASRPRQSGARVSGMARQTNRNAANPITASVPNAAGAPKRSAIQPASVVPSVAPIPIANPT